MFFLEFLARVFVKEEPSWVRYQKYNKTHPKSCHSPRSVVDNLYFPLLALDESTRWTPKAAWPTWAAIFPGPISRLMLTTNTILNSGISSSSKSSLSVSVSSSESSEKRVKKKLIEVILDPMLTSIFFRQKFLQNQHFMKKMILSLHFTKKF